jgi:signal transduction histidine kinase
MSHGRSSVGALRWGSRASGRRRTVTTTSEWYRAAAEGGHFGELWLLAVAAGSFSVVALEFLHPVAYHAPAMRAATETVITLCAFTAAWLLRVQFRRSRRVRDLLLMGTVLTVGLLDGISYALPALRELRSGRGFAAAVMIGMVLVAGVLVAAARVPSDLQVGRRRRPELFTLVGAFVAAGVAESGGLLLRDQLSIAGSHPISGISAASQKPLAVTLVLITAGLFIYAAILFAVHERGERSGVSILVAGAAILLVSARIYYLALPASGPDWITSREVLRLFAFVLLMSAAVQQEVRSRTGLARATALAERHRVARDLHDGIAQDLAFIAAHGARITEVGGEEHPVAVAARRALAISRGKISELSDERSSTAKDALQALALELASRFEIVIDVSAPAEAELEYHQRQDVLRIVREAIANAARHGDAEHVYVSLRRTRWGTLVRVCDDGRGIATVCGAKGEGFGLRSMRERATALGGQLIVRERQRGGTELRVQLP